VGATFQGYIWIGNYKIEMWTYDGWYLDPVTQDARCRTYRPNKVIILSEAIRLDLAYGALPLLRKPSAEIMSILPPRISSVENGFDMSVNAYYSEDGEQLFIRAGTRPLPIPTELDKFGCLTTR
jgi:hypothetical protein